MHRHRLRMGILLQQRFRVLLMMRGEGCLGLGACAPRVDRWAGARRRRAAVAGGDGRGMAMGAGALLVLGRRRGRGM